MLGYSSFRTWRRSTTIMVLAAWCVVSIAGPARAINIVIDYRYDNAATPFFNTQQKKNALQAAADRLSDIITTSLTAVTFSNGANNDPRISFTHPTTGVSNYQVSPATNSGNDSLVTLAGVSPANEYRGPWSIGADDWVLYPGGRSLTSSAVGGTGTGTNFTSTFEDANSHVNRNFRSSGSASRLPVWGGAISFDNDGSTNWHYDHTTIAPAGTVDLYSIALHEIAHALGLSSGPSGNGWADWYGKTSGSTFIGANAVNAYNADNGTSVTSLNLESAANHHWDDGAYDSYIFQNGSPNLVGTVGLGAKQDLIMEPTANFTGSIRRFEMTNVDVAALKDVGWSVLPTVTSLPGDYNLDGRVDSADYVMWRKGAASGNYATWRANFGRSLSGAGGGNSPGVPEPSSVVLLVIGMLASCSRRRMRRFSG